MLPIRTRWVTTTTVELLEGDGQRHRVRGAFLPNLGGHWLVASGPRLPERALHALDRAVEQVAPGSRLAVARQLRRLDELQARLPDALGGLDPELSACTARALQRCCGRSEEALATISSGRLRRFAGAWTCWEPATESLLWLGFRPLHAWRVRGPLEVVWVAHGAPAAMPPPPEPLRGRWLLVAAREGEGRRGRSPMGSQAC